MYLANLKLWNFRKFACSLGDIDLEKPALELPFLPGINVLIGENDSGKSAIIDAIKLVLKTHSFEWIRIFEEDFSLDRDRIRIELLFKDISDDEARHFTEFLGMEKDHEENDHPFLKLIYDVKKVNGKIFPSDIRGGADDEGGILSADAREYLKVTYLKPLRDAKQELIPRKNSRLSQILIGHEAFKGKYEDHLLMSLFGDFNRSVERYFYGKKVEKNEEGKEIEENLEDQLGKNLKDEIDRYIRSFFGGSKKTQVNISEGNLKNILERLLLSIEGDYNMGLGSLNRLFMASELLHLNKNDWDGLRLGLVEELEAHLHPQAQMQVIEALQSESNIQLLLTTHSPNLASKVPLENIILCTSDSAFPLEASSTMLESDDYEHLERFLDVTKANLFFAKGIILVEGWSEELLMPALAKALKREGLISKDLTEAGVSVVNVGNTEFLRFSKIFLRSRGHPIGIPVAIITDSDIRAYQREVVGQDATGRNQYNYVKRDADEVVTETTAKVAGLNAEFDEQAVKSFIAPNWTLEYCLYLSPSLNAAFVKCVKDLYPQIDNGDVEENIAKRLINKDFKKSRLAYSLASCLDKGEFQIDEQPIQKIQLDITDQYIKYLFDSIKYAINE